MTHTKHVKASEGLLGALDRRTFLAGSAATMATIIAASQSSRVASAQEVRRGGHLKLGLAGAAATDSEDPAKFQSQFMLCASRCWGDTLVESHPLTGEPVPSLASSWHPSADASTWTFKIRSDVTFHNGKKLKADDVVATLRRHADPKVGSGALGGLTSVKSINASGDDLVIALNEGNVDMPLVLSDWHLVIQPAEGDDAASIGTGPYRMTDFKAGIRANFEKNDKDWRSDRGFVDSVEMIAMNDATARVAALSSGQVHYINRVDPKTVSLLKRNTNLEILSTEGRGHYVFVMQCDKQPFDNNDLRLALKFSVDREEMVQRILGGYGKVGNDFPINSTYTLFPETIEQRSFDTDKAAFHYRKSGHSGPILLHTSDVAFPGAVDAAVLIQQSAKKAGIDVQVKREPEEGYWSNVWNVQPFLAAYWGGRPTQDQMYSTAYLSSVNWNESHFRRPDFDEMLFSARSEFDVEIRKALYHEMAVMVRDEGGTILPTFNNFINASSKQVKGYVHDIMNDMSNGYVATRVWLDA